MSWRGTYTYSRSDLIEYLRTMRRGEFDGGYLLRREVHLQASERGLIKLPENCIIGDAHRIPFSEVVILEPLINVDVTPNNH
jgi:hypothetical protein